MKGTWAAQFERGYRGACDSESEHVHDYRSRLDSESEAVLGGAEAFADAAAGNAMSALRFGLEMCESPIEEAMFVALSVVDLQTCDGVEIVRSGVRTTLGSCGDVPDILVLEPQFKVGRYRADLRVVHRVRWGLGDAACAEAQVLLECDGHDFHERSKEQAKRDRRRDRKMQAEGFKVLRFTGSEIWENPIATALEACEQLQDDALLAMRQAARESLS